MRKQKNTRCGVSRLAFLAALSIALLVGGTLALRTEVKRCRVTPENHKKIVVGMKREQVEKLLGGPPGDYSSGPSVYSASHIWWSESDSKWVGDECMIVVRFDGAGGVARWFFSPEPMTACIPFAVPDRPRDSTGSPERK